MYAKEHGKQLSCLRAVVGLTETISRQLTTLHAQKRDKPAEQSSPIAYITNVISAVPSERAISSGPPNKVRSQIKN